MHAALAQKFYISSVFNLLMTTSNAFFISVIVFKNIFSIYFLFFLKICISLLILFICSHMLSTLSIRALRILVRVVLTPGLMSPTSLPYLSLVLILALSLQAVFSAFKNVL